MSKKVYLDLVGLSLIGLAAVSLLGCSQAGTTLGATITDVTTIGTSEVTISGSVKYSSGTVDINLNPVLVSGEAITLDTSKVKVRIGTDSTLVTTSDVVTVTLPSASSKPLEIVFILDNTGSMSSSITGAKNSIIAFSASLEAAGIDAKFGLVTFGDSALHPTPAGYITSEGISDATHERPVLDFGTAAALQTKLASVDAFTLTII